jgi:fucose 4-O-acetylase-like acetyltransferase
MKTQRFVWADICRGFGIILVVASHVLIMGEASYERALAWGIFLFHIPLFLFFPAISIRPYLPSI